MNASQAERLTAVIEEEILSLRLKPGDKLDELASPKSMAPLARLSGKRSASFPPAD